VKTHTVVIENMRFNPETLAVRNGDRIVWVNKDLFPHTATGKARQFDSGSIAANASWTYVVRKPGSYAYNCAFHPTMAGTLTVK
jgi:plastocyanin